MALFFSFRGRVGRQEYWLTVIGAWVVLFAGAVLVRVLMDFVGEVGTIAILPVFGLVVWAMLAMLVRRIHDRGRSAWWLVPMMGPVVVLNVLAAIAVAVVGPDAGLPFRGLALPFTIWALIDLGLLPGTPEPNDYGPPLSRPVGPAEVFD